MRSSRKNKPEALVSHALFCRDRLLRQSLVMPHTVIPDLIRNPGTFQENFWIPAFAGMTSGVAILPEVLVKGIFLAIPYGCNQRIGLTDVPGVVYCSTGGLP